jgi:uncharacterized protein
LTHHYIAHRGHVRAKVACLRNEQGDVSAAGEAGALLSLARDHLERGQVRMVLVGGLPGTGKTPLRPGSPTPTGGACCARTGPAATST